MNISSKYKFPLKACSHLALIIGFITISPSCEETKFVDITDDQNKLVLNGIMSPDFGLWINVSQSVSTSRTENYSFVPVTNAVVDYYENNDLISSIVENDLGNYYQTEYKPGTNNTYEIRVNAPGLPEAHATVIIPDPVEISGFHMASVVTGRNNYYHNDTLHYEVEFFADLSFADPGSSSNYYMLGAYYWENGAYHPLEAETEDINMNIHIQDAIGVLSWDDSQINGQAYEFSVKFRLHRYEGFQTRVRIVLYSISRDYHLYLKSFSQNFTVLNDATFFFEPVEVSTNIVGGWGIISAVSSSTRSFDYTF